MGRGYFMLLQIILSYLRASQKTGEYLSLLDCSTIATNLYFLKKYERYSLTGYVTINQRIL